jgi:glycosyltransferase involved in cell wall biosynthesis
MRTDPHNVLLITARADYGGGPEHIYRLIDKLEGLVNYFIAAPEDYPYWERFISALTRKKLFRIPHRKFSVSYLIKLVSFAKENKITLIHSHGKGAGIYGRLLSLITGIKCIHTFHGIHTGNYNSAQKFVYSGIERFLSLFTDHFISVSNSEAGTAADNKMAPRSRITVIPNGTYIPVKVSSFTQSSSAVYIISTITRFDFAKNTGLLIQIASEIRRRSEPGKFLFRIIGSGPEEIDFKNKMTAETLADMFEFTGFVPDASEFLMNSFCYISTSKWEGLPLGVLEAMSLGIPVVASDVTGNKDLVNHGFNGFLYGLSSPGEAADFILKLAEDQETYRLFSERSRAMIKESYSVDNMANKTLNLYNNFF